VKASIDSAYIAAAGLDVTEISLTETEQIQAVRFAADVDDGEAEALAVAKERALPLLSDDLGAARVASRYAIPLKTTLDLIYVWANGAPAPDVSRALRSLRARANYAPPRSHPLRAWYLLNITGA
jgi:predicted nucleic acid-binding protein